MLQGLSQFKQQQQQTDLALLPGMPALQRAHKCSICGGLADVQCAGTCRMWFCLSHMQGAMDMAGVQHEGGWYCAED